ncbi:sugar kinase [Comamonas composti]|uniref:sugar kinase n=1 Tax=Comamonas composti TaxID=408558 RepID=UPI0003FD1142|nr:sugar kinase [Comamonas composti]
MQHGTHSKTWDLVTLGEALIEFNQTHAGQPEYLQGFGGDTSNAAIAAARAGARTAYLTRVGQDTFGDALLALWQREGVDHTAVQRDAKQPTGMYFVTHGEAGHQFSYLRAGSAASHMTPAWVESSPALQLLQDCRLFMVSGISLAISPTACDTAFAAMRMARAAGAQIALDSNLRLKLWPLERARACIAHAVSLCDIFLPSLEDMVTLTGLTAAQDIIAWSHAHGAATVVLKLGAEGCMVSTQQSKPPHASTHIAGRPVALTDATGAGDCFDGNLLARLALGNDLATAARYANTAASLAVQGFGAVAPLPYAAQVNAALVQEALA